VCWREPTLGGNLAQVRDSLWREPFSGGSQLWGQGKRGEVDTWQGIDVWGGRTLSRERMCVGGSCMSVLGLPCVLEFCAVKGAEWWLASPGPGSRERRQRA
jgi:hypothetical protein